MYADFIYPAYEVVRNYDRCIACREPFEHFKPI